MSQISTDVNNICYERYVVAGHAHLIICNATSHSVITTWRTFELVRWSDTSDT